MFVARRGARLCEEQREERNTNREGVASGSATRVLKKVAIYAKNLKICGSFAKAPSHEKHFAPLDVRGLWHALPLPTASTLDKSRTAAAQHKKSTKKLN